MFSIRKNLTAGFLATVPLWVTWLVMAFVLGLAVDLAGPLTRWFIYLIGYFSPESARLLGLEITRYLVSIILLLAILYTLGWLTTHFVGRQLIRIFERLVLKIPFVGRIYYGTKQIIDAFQVKPDQAERVVLIEYPHPGMKTIGLVTKTMTDRFSPRSLLAVYVPTTPNPTSGYLEIVPAENVTPIDWSVNDAIAFIVSGGSVGPVEVDYYKKSISGEDDTG